MRSVTTELVHLLFSVPFYLVVLFGGLSVAAWFGKSATNLGHRRYTLMTATLVAYLATTPVVSNTLVNWLEHRYPVPPANAVDRAKPAYIIVLSGGWFRSVTGGYEIKLGATSWERTRAAVELWRRTGGTLIFTGAPLPDQSDSVAQAMGRLALEWGVPSARVQVETKSRNTKENLAFTRDMLGLSGKDQVILLTSAMHLPRSVEIAGKLGLQVIPYPCDFRGDEKTRWRHWLPSNEAMVALEGALHEIVGMVFNRLHE